MGLSRLGESRSTLVGVFIIGVKRLIFDVVSVFDEQINGNLVVSREADKSRRLSVGSLFT